MLSRAERRRENRKNEKLFKWLMLLNREQRNLLTEYCIETTKSDILAFGQAFERVLRVSLQDLFEDEFKAEECLKAIVDTVEEEGKAMRKFENGSVEYMANLKQFKEEMIKKYEDKKIAGVKEKEIFNQLKMDYPKFTLSAIRNVIAEHKRDLRKAAPVTADELDTEEIVKDIFEDEEVIENKARTEEKEVEGKIYQEENKNLSTEQIEGQNDEIKSNIIEITEIRKFKGQFGEYLKTKDGVKLDELLIKNNDEASEYKEMVEAKLELERKEFEKKQDEARIKAYGKLDEILKILEM